MNNAGEAALSRDMLQMFFHETSRGEFLTLEEEIDLARRIQEGDETATQKLVRANIPFAISVAKKYRDSGIPLEDLIEEGIIGLITAANRYDPDYGVKFITYAVWWIRCTILEAISQNSGITRLPGSRIRLLAKIKRDLRCLEQQLGRKASTGELSDYCHTEPREIDLLNSTLSSASSLDAPQGGQDNMTLSETLPNTSFLKGQRDLDRKELIDILKKAFLGLDERQSDIINRYYGLDGSPSLTLEAIGEKYGISRERVRQVKEQALRILHSALEDIQDALPH